MSYDDEYWMMSVDHVWDYVFVLNEMMNEFVQEELKILLEKKMLKKIIRE